jgi:hypothetical protein
MLKMCLFETLLIFFWMIFRREAAGACSPIFDMSDEIKLSVSAVFVVVVLLGVVALDVSLIARLRLFSCWPGICNVC